MLEKLLVVYMLICVNYLDQTDFTSNVVIILLDLLYPVPVPVSYTIIHYNRALISYSDNLVVSFIHSPTIISVYFIIMS